MRKKKYIISVFDGPSGGGGDEWPYPPVKEVMAASAEDAIMLVAPKIRAAARKEGYNRGWTLTIKAVSGSGEVALEEIEV